MTWIEDTSAFCHLLLLLFMRGDSEHLFNFWSSVVHISTNMAVLDGRMKSCFSGSQAAALEHSVAMQTSPEHSSSLPRANY